MDDYIYVSSMAPSVYFFACLFLFGSVMLIFDHNLQNTFHLWNLLTEWPSFELLHRKNGFFQLQTSVQELLIRVQTVNGFFFLFIQQRTFKETGCSTTSPSDLPKIFRYDLLSYKVLFNKGTIHLLHLLNLGIFLYFYIEFSF